MNKGGKNICCGHDSFHNHRMAYSKRAENLTDTHLKDVGMPG